MLDQYFIFEELDDDGYVTSKRYVPLRVRYIFHFEMQNMLELCGYHVEHLYGNFHYGSFRYGGQQVWVARC
ncbi:MAG TPA: hypothetical protein VKK79_08215 [Candidatus Lokiarchaeia archaeon]|nr:hypothetical protein [Candidatus Lokiarchaeia archaeon]